MVDFIRDRNNLVTVKQAAEICKVDPVTIRRWMKFRGLVFTKIVGRVLISLADLNSFQGKPNEHTIQAIVVDAQTLAAIKELRADGYKIDLSPEGNRDGRSNAASREKATAKA